MRKLNDILKKDGSAADGKLRLMAFPLCGTLIALALLFTLGLTLSDAFAQGGANPARYNAGTGNIHAASADKWERLEGKTRVSVARNVSRTGWDDGSCDTVIIVTTSAGPDSSTATALAGLYDSPILLTEPSRLSPETRAEVQRLGAKHAIIVGGTNAVYESVALALKSMLGSFNVKRVAGTTRYETAIKVYEEGMGEWSDVCMVMSGANGDGAYSATASPDGVAAAAVCYSMKIPAFLADNTGAINTRNKNTLTQAKENGQLSKVVIAGGENVVSADTETWLRNLFGENNVIRLSGTTRYHTSQKITEWAAGKAASAAFQPPVTLGYSKPVAVSGVDGKLIYSLVGGALAGHNNSVLVLTNNNSSSTYSQKIITDASLPYSLAANKSQIEHGYALGDSTVLSDETLDILNESTS